MWANTCKLFKQIIQVNTSGKWTLKLRPSRLGLAACSAVARKLTASWTMPVYDIIYMYMW